jgi:transposase
MIDRTQLQDMGADELRALALELMTEVQAQQHIVDRTEAALRFSDAKLAQLTHEMAILKRWKFAARSEKLSHEQQSLLDETIDSDLAAIELELERLSTEPKTKDAPNKPRRAPLPANLPRVNVHHEPESTVCGCGCELKRIGEDVSEKLDYTPGVFTVERHVRGKWVCARCETLTQAPVPAHVIDKGIPTAGLLAHVLVSKHGDHLPLYRQERIFARAGLAIPRSTLGQWVGMCGVQLQPLVDALKKNILKHRVLHADETPISMLSPGKGKTHRAYLWTYCPGAFEQMKAVVYDFAESRAGEHARAFLDPWRGHLVCDDFAGY